MLLSKFHNLPLLLLLWRTSRMRRIRISTQAPLESCSLALCQHGRRHWRNNKLRRISVGLIELSCADRSEGVVAHKGRCVKAPSICVLDRYSAFIFRFKVIYAFVVFVFVRFGPYWRHSPCNGSSARSIYCWGYWIYLAGGWNGWELGENLELNSWMQ